MPFREWRLRIDDILECIAKIERYTEGMAFEDFIADDLTVDAVLRRIEIIGEAARNVPDDVGARFSDIPWNKLRSMRNVIVHEYFGVSLRIIWQTIKSDLPLWLPRCEEYPVHLDAGEAFCYYSPVVHYL